MLELRGEIKTVIFNSADSGYTVIDVQLDSGEFITAVGVFPPVTESETVVMRGDFKFHSKHGRQFLVDDAEVYPPEQAESIVKYLSSGLFKGVGEVTARAIVMTFGNQTLNVIENSPTQLYRVKGVSLKKAMEIGLAYNEVRRMQDAILFLQRYKISINMAIKIYKIYGAQTQNKVKENPYRLIDDVDGIGFTTADKIAQEMGIAEDSDFRIQAGVVYALKEASSKNGHTYLPEEQLKKEVFELLGFDEERGERVRENISEMLFLSVLSEYNKGGRRVLMLYKNFVIEQSIARCLNRLMAEHKPSVIDPDDAIRIYESDNGIELHDNQKTAVRCALQQGVEVITGGPGTGKTTIIKCILNILKSLGSKVVLCAPTGRAAKRLGEATGEEAKTIHRLLDLDYKNGNGYFTYNETTRLDADVIIVDEVSMVDEYVFNSLIKAINRGSRLILVGDKDQLPSVGAGNVLADIIGCGRFPVTYLTHIYRQAQESLIVMNAHRINKGQAPVIDAVDKDFFFEERDTPVAAKNDIVELVTRRLPEYLKIPAEEIQVLCPMKKGVAGVEGLNREIRAKLNPLKLKGAEIRRGEDTYRVGDKVMQIVNNYQQEWVQYNEKRTDSGTGVFNGDMGYIEEINTLNEKFKVRFTDNKVAIYPFADIDQLVLAYAVSIHKSQGSEFDAVVISVSGSNVFLMTRNLLYTAVTRAKKLAVLVGTKDALMKMVKNNYTATRYSLLKDFILDEAVLD